MIPICLRTPDRLKANDVVRFDGHDPAEEVLRVHELDAGARLVRTRTNLHYCAAGEFIEVLAESVPGLGFVVTPAVPE